MGLSAVHDALAGYDEADFAAALPLLSPTARSWLVQALDVAHPEHAWRRRLA